MPELSKEQLDRLWDYKIVKGQLHGLDELHFKCSLCGGDVSGWCTGIKFQFVEDVLQDDFIWLGVALVKDAKIVRDHIAGAHFICKECFDA